MAGPARPRGAAEAWVALSQGRERAGEEEREREMKITLLAELHSVIRL